MALANNAQLEAAVADWLNRSDLTNQIPDFITLAESTMRRRLRRVVDRKTINISAITFSLSTVTSPSVSEVRALRLQTSTASRNKPMEQITAVQLGDSAARFSGNGQPTKFAVVNNVILFNRTPDQTYAAELIYFADLTSITASTALLLEAPDLYLYGALLEAAPFLEHDERIPIWQSRFERAVSELNVRRERQELGGHPSPMRLPVVFTG